MKKCACLYPLFCDDQGYDPVKKENPLYKLEGGEVKATGEEEVKETGGEVMEIIGREVGDGKKATSFETKYVYEVYERIAPHFSQTRYAPWPRIEEFMKSLTVGSLVADIGRSGGRDTID